MYVHLICPLLKVVCSILVYLQDQAFVGRASVPIWLYVKIPYEEVVEEEGI
jgi:hypothetical protein